jgi:hypothetical protein
VARLSPRKNKRELTPTKKNKKEEKKKEDFKTDVKKTKEGKIEEKKENKKEDKDATTNEEKNENKNKLYPTQAIVLSFENYKNDEEKKKISFDILFVPIHRKIEAELKVSLNIKYKSGVLRVLQDDVEKKEVDCKKVDSKLKKVKYHCEFESEKKIENIEVNEDDFKFTGQKVDIKAWSPLAIKQKKKLQEFGKEDTFNKKLYILESSEKSQDDKSINIIGKINDKKFEHDTVTLTIASSDKTKEKKVECAIEKKKGKYNLRCQPKEDIEGPLDGVFGDMDDEQLIINFKKGVDCNILFTVEKPKPKKKKEEKKQKAPEKKDESENDDNSNSDENENENESIFEKKIFGLISLKSIIIIVIAIIIALVVVIAFILFCLKKQEDNLEYNRNRMDNSMDAIMSSQIEIK